MSTGRLELQGTDGAIACREGDRLTVTHRLTEYEFAAKIGETIWTSSDVPDSFPDQRDPIELVNAAGTSTSFWAKYRDTGPHHGVQLTDFPSAPAPPRSGGGFGFAGNVVHAPYDGDIW